MHHIVRINNLSFLISPRLHSLHSFSSCPAQFWQRTKWTNRPSERGKKTTEIEQKCQKHQNWHFYDGKQMQNGNEKNAALNRWLRFSKMKHNECHSLLFHLPFLFHFISPCQPSQQDPAASTVTPAPAPTSQSLHRIIWKLRFVFHSVWSRVRGHSCWFGRPGEGVEWGQCRIWHKTHWSGPKAIAVLLLLLISLFVLHFSSCWA